MVADIFDVIHPNRKLAIQILEAIAEKMGKLKIFDKMWYELEDMLVELISDSKL